MGVAALDQEEFGATETFLEYDLLWHYACVGAGPLPATATAAAQSLPARLPDHSAASSSRLLLRRVFRCFDRNRDGLVSAQEISRIGEALGIPQKEESIRALMACFPAKSNDCIDEDEFCLLFDSACNTPATMLEGLFAVDAYPDSDASLVQAFRVFDKDGNGFISATELQSVLCSLGFTHANQLQDCVEMIAQVDDNADGQVDFFEFKRLFDMESDLHLIGAS